MSFSYEPIGSSLVSLVSFHLGQFLGSFLFFMTFTLFKNTSLLFCGMSLNLSCQIFPHNKIHVTQYWQEHDRKVFCAFLSEQWIIGVAHDAHISSLLVMLTSVTCFRWCLPGFSTVGYCFPLLWLISILREDIWHYVSILFMIIFSPLI